MLFDAGRDAAGSTAPLRKPGHEVEESPGRSPWGRLPLHSPKLRDDLVMHCDLNACAGIPLDPTDESRQLFPRLADREFHDGLRSNKMKCTPVYKRSQCAGVWRISPRGGAIERGLAKREELAGDGALSLRTGCLEDIMQLALQAQAVRPAPQVIEVELEMRVLDDADHVVKVPWPAGAQFHEDEVFR